MPWIHFHIGNAGTAQACCVANIPYGNINEQSLEEIWNGPEINQLRAKFIKGETDNRCANCHRLEAAGAKSIRQETFEKFAHIKVDEVEVQLPIYFDIRFSNVCNFRCRTCWHGASSRWFNDAKVLGTNIGEQAILTNIKDVKSFIENSAEALLGAEEFYFAGGEPLVTEGHYLLLEWLIENKATQARLRYNTNFSKLDFQDYDLLKLWSHFTQVELLASIDASGMLGEYIRKEMNWKTLVENRERIKALPHVAFKIAPTVSVFNVLELPDLYQECLASGMIEAGDIYINILERPNYYNIQILPEAEKSNVQLRYQQFYNWLAEKQAPTQVASNFKEIISYMMESDRSNLWPRFQQQTAQLDELRGESFDEVKA